MDAHERMTDEKNTAIQAAALIVSNNLSTFVGGSDDTVQIKIKTGRAVADLAFRIKEETKNL